MSSRDLFEVEIADIAHGGEGVGRIDGKAHFVPDVIPGETVVGRILKDGGSWARGELIEVRTEHPERVAPPCPHASDCGGCQWQHATHHAQLGWKENTLAGQLQHLGKLEDPPVREIASPGPALGYRNRMDFAVKDAKPAMHRARSHELVPLDVCLLLDPVLAEAWDRIEDLTGVSKLTLRCGTNTGDTLAVIDGEIPPGATEWGMPLAVRRGKRVEPVDSTGRITEAIGEHRFRISGTNFFQNNSHGAARLVDLVEEALEPQPEDTLLDAYAGVGLFGVSLSEYVARVLYVESNVAAIEDLRANASAVGRPHRVIRGKMERVAGDLDEYPDLAVADPPRTGLGEAGVAAVTAGYPRRLAYVSCDPAALARDVVLLRTAGYSLEWVAPVDLFPQTYHIEAVAAFILA